MSVLDKVDRGGHRYLFIMFNFMNMVLQWGVSKDIFILYMNCVIGLLEIFM